jgi:hypothetical protein
MGLDTLRSGYAHDRLDLFRDGSVPSDAPMQSDERQALAIKPLTVPSDTTNLTLRIAGVEPGDQTLNVEFAIARPGDPASVISVGARTAGRQHGMTNFPDSELRFNIGAAVHRRGGLGLGEYRSPTPQFIPEWRLSHRPPVMYGRPPLGKR